MLPHCYLPKLALYLIGNCSRHSRWYDVCRRWRDAARVSFFFFFFGWLEILTVLFFPCISGNFADELGEDFLGLRELGIDREYGLASLTVPQSLFYGRRKRLANSANGAYVIYLLFGHSRSDIYFLTNTILLFRVVVPANLTSLILLHHLSSLSRRQHFPPTYQPFSMLFMLPESKQVSRWTKMTRLNLPILRSEVWDRFW